MKPLTKLLVALPLVFAMAFSPILAQQNGDSRRARDIDIAYDEGRIDGMRIGIHKIVQGGPVPVLLTEEFNSGDFFRIEFESNFAGYVYILNVGPSGKTCLLFPYVGNSVNEVKARQSYLLPSKADKYKFNDKNGDEVLQVYMSHQQLALFDDLLKSAADQSLTKPPCLGESAVKAAKELAKGAAKEGAVPSQSHETPAGSSLLAENRRHARGVELYLGEESGRKETTVAVEKDKGDGHLQKDDIAFYEIHLKHK